MASLIHAGWGEENSLGKMIREQFVGVSGDDKTHNILTVRQLTE
jgi:hypothetical protein